MEIHTETRTKNHGDPTTAPTGARTEPPARSPHDDLRAELLDVFARQRHNRWAVANTTAAVRVTKLRRLKRLIIARQDELRKAIHADFRKPAAEVDLTELQPVLVELNHTIRHLRKWMRPTRVGKPLTLIGTSSQVRYEPKGVVLILAPWNYPFNLLMGPLIAAVAAGNCVMVRPSDKVKHTARFIKELLDDVFPRDEVAVFTGPSSVANALLELPFDHVLFTGSARVGRQVMSAAAAHLASVTLELGGQSPVIVDETADARLAAERVVWGKFLNAGQTCVAPNHVFVHESRMAEFVSHAREIIARRFGATDVARRESADFARIVDQASCRRLGELIERSVARGATIEIGGQVNVEERYVAPTVLSGVSDDSPAMQEEIFGPVLPVLSYRTLEDVLASIHQRGKPLAMYVFSRARAHIERLLGHTSAGGTVINNVIIHLANPDLPFGGTGESGFGNYHGRYGFKTFSHERAVLSQGRFSPLPFFYPPYAGRANRLVKFLTRFFS